MTHRHAPRTLSSCCRARVVAQHCSECGKAAPWRTRLTEEEAERIAARERPAAGDVTRGVSAAQAKVHLYGGDND